MSEHNGFERITVKADDFLFNEGDAGEAAYLIVSGRVEIRTGAKSDAPRTVAKLGKGDIVGEMALFDRKPRMASAIAAEDTVAIRIAEKEFRARLEHTDPVMRSIITILVKRLREMSDQVAELKSMDWRSPGA
jgi:CRP/FNR family transcriptional regulator, cyclic AMP receptor protein